MIITDEDRLRLDKISKEYIRLRELLTYEEVFLDKKLFLNLQKKKQSLELLFEKYTKYNEFLSIKQDLNELIELSDFEEKSSYEKSLLTINEDICILEEDLKKLILRFNAVMEKVVVEIVKNNQSEMIDVLTNGIINFCKNNAFDIDLKTNNSSVEMVISGLNSYVCFSNLSGMHIIKKSSKEEDFKVFVYKYIDDTECLDDDIKIEVCRSSGAGGQHINTTDSAVRATHLKTGISLVCQDERSQIQNRQKAIENLKKKVLAYYVDEKRKVVEKAKKEQLVKMSISKFTRFYNFDNGKVITNNLEEFLLKDFLQGKVL